jgi:predicted GNAT family acetyltransferase
MEKFNIIDNGQKSRFEVNLGSDTAYMEYRYQQETRVLMHTYIPEQYRGKGNLAKFIQEVLDQIRASNEEVMINCASVTRFLRDNPEYNDVVKKFRPIVRKQQSKKVKS